MEQKRHKWPTKDLVIAVLLRTNFAMYTSDVPYFICDREQVVKRLIRLRCQYADKQAKYAQEIRYLKDVDAPTINNAETKADRDFLYSLFPPRKKWCSVGKRGDHRRDDSAEYRNRRALWYTYRKAVQDKSAEDWYKRLIAYADEIVAYVHHPDIIRKPCVIPTPKKDKPHQYRPICSFRLKERIALTIINKCLTDKLDPHFLPCSYAFRSRRADQEYAFMHLPAVLQLQQYRKEHGEQLLYVAECDMKKFYDTIDHDVIWERFEELLDGIKDMDLYGRKLYEQWMGLYLDCYNFNDDVYVPSKDDALNLWKNKKDPKEKEDYILWVDECEKLPVDRINRIGVPQGGSLSTLIANIVLHDVDKEVMKAIGDDDMLYMRFCDDMILVGTDAKKTKHVFEIYQDAIKRSQLYPHAPEDLKIPYDKTFWDGKTRGPYVWGDRKTNHFPWVAFVGFECHWQGAIRIRKCSFKKELEKQEKVVRRIVKPIKNGVIQPRYNNRTLLGFIEKRLIAMSVGRVNMRNFKYTDNAHSWMSAYSILDANRWSKEQLRTLDRNRRRVLTWAMKNLPKPNEKTGGRTEKGKKECLFHGEPFSYYGQCFTYKGK